MKISKFLRRLPLGVGLWVSLLSPTLALPPADDIPEEILRTEIITEARSPVDGKPLTAAEYAEVMAKLAENPFPVEVNATLQKLIVLLRLRKMLKTFLPLPF